MDQARLDSAVRARRATEEQYASEKAQTELMAARTREARTLADLSEARAGLDRATAATIESLNIQIR